MLPLAHHESLVGLLFIEGSSSPVTPALTELTAEALSSSTALSRWPYFCDHPHPAHAALNWSVITNTSGITLRISALQQHTQQLCCRDAWLCMTAGASCRARQHRILQALGEQGFGQLRQAAQVLSLACSLDQRAGLQRSRDAAKSQHISGLVEQVSSSPQHRLCLGGPLPGKTHRDKEAQRTDKPLDPC